MITDHFWYLTYIWAKTMSNNQSTKTKAKLFQIFTSRFWGIDSKQSQEQYLSREKIASSANNYCHLSNSGRLISCLKYFRKTRGKTPFQSLFLNKVAGLSSSVLDQWKTVSQWMALIPQNWLAIWKCIFSIFELFLLNFL